MRKRALSRAIAGAAVVLHLPAASAGAQSVRVAEVRLESNQTIRELAERYLGDPDLWPEILKASNIASVADLSAGTLLRGPVDVIAAADRAMDRAIGQIRKANVAGAQLFAPDEVGQAIKLHAQALDERIKREWAASR